MIIDTNTSCLGWSSFLKMRGVEFVGRYYTVAHPSYALTKAEAVELSRAGIGIFVVYEDHGHRDAFKLTRSQGDADAGNALNFAKNLIGQPQGTVIYFAVEGLPDGYKTADLDGVRNYFEGVTNKPEDSYKVGVYGDGIVCQTLKDENICEHTWLAQASYSFEGSIDFYASKEWRLAQIVDDLSWKHPRDAQKAPLSIDINEGLGDIGAFSIQEAIV